MISRLAISAALALACVTCANKVPQNKNTGPDGSYKTPKEMRLENNEASSSGIVTYPGGDRSDWKLLEIPDKKTGTLEIKLSWKPPRPGLQLAFEVYDEYFHEAIKSKASARKKKGRIKNESVPNMKGKVYIRVYAVNRGDAGSYKLTVEFKESQAALIFDPLALQIPDPPRLAEVPAVVIPCDDTNFDPKKPECKNFCPAAGAPPAWPPCNAPGKCPTPPDPKNLKCWEDPNTRPPCPTPWDPAFVRWCKPPPCPVPPDPANPNCAPKPLTARIVKVDINGSDVLPTVAAGLNQGITSKWRAQVLRGDTETPLPGGDATIIRVDKTKTVLKVSLTPDQLKVNSNVKFTPP